MKAQRRPYVAALFWVLPPLAAAGLAVAQEPLVDPPFVLNTPAEAYVFEEVPELLRPRGLPQLRLDFDSGGFARLYGHVNWGVLNYDDGREIETYAPLDNANSVSRLGLLAEQPLSEDLLATVRLEVGYGPFSSFNVNQLDRQPDFEFNENNIRHIDLNLRHDVYGALSLGQGGMATNGDTLIDFSGTNLIAYSSVGDSAGGQFLRFADPATPISDAPQIRSAYQGFDGPRRVRVRYDTPIVKGVHASAAYGRNLLTTDSSQHDENLYDVSLTYGGAVSDFRLGGAVGYFFDRFEREILAGSGSVFHEPTGLNVSIAGARADLGTSNRTADYVYTKAGLRRDFFPIGDTAMSIDYYSGDDMTVNGADSNSWGLALVQYVESVNTELWFTLRFYDYNDPTAEFEDGRAIFGGFRFRF